MKLNIKYLLSTGLVALGLSSCTDLDVDLNSQYTEYPDNPVAVEAKLTQCYYALRGQLQRDYKEGLHCSSDEFTPVSFDGDYAETRYTHAYYHNHYPDDASIGVWGDLAGGIVTCNNVINEIGGAEGRDAVVAPVRCMRAFYHFIMMDAYGDVPLADHNPANDEEVVRAPRAEVAKFIESELLDIIPQLTEEVSDATYTRPTKWVAQALLAKLYINWPVYMAESCDKYNAAAYSNEKLNDCIAAIDDIITSGKFEVGNNYRAKFLPNNGPQIKDFIYAYDYDPAKGIKSMDWARYVTFRMANKAPTSYYGFSLGSSVGGNLAVTPEMTDLLTALPGDERAKTIIVGPVYIMDPSNYEYTSKPWEYEGQQAVFTRDITLKDQNDPDNNVGKNVAGWCMGAKSVKFPPSPDDYSIYSRAQFNDVPIFRLADMLLLKAEAIVRGGTATLGDTPAGLINKVRDCAKAQHISGNVTLQDVLDERGRELFMEVWRRNDLIRYGKYEDKWGVKATNNSANFDPKHRVWPVPQGIMDTNANWQQNLGY